MVGPSRISTAASRPIDYATGCPKDGNYSAIFAVLLDTTDPLSPVQQAIVEKKLDEFAEKVPRYGKLEVFAVRPSSDRLIEPLLQVCNPGRASDTNRVDREPAPRRRRDGTRNSWIRWTNPSRLRFPVVSVRSNRQSWRRFKQVSVQAFFETPQKTSKRLAIVSDMLQNSAVLNQYRHPESFEEFEHQRSFVKVRPELNDVGVTILYVRRSSEFNRQGERHVEFWQSFFAASGARIEEVMSVSG